MWALYIFTMVIVGLLILVIYKNSEAASALQEKRYDDATKSVTVTIAGTGLALAVAILIFLLIYYGQYRRFGL
jgi:ABC-type Fe3+ transport system permease subunit